MDNSECTPPDLRPICSSCRFYKWNGRTLDKECRVKVYLRKDLVTGEVYEAGVVSAYTARDVSGVCKPSGELWEPASTGVSSPRRFWRLFLSYFWYD